MDATKALAAAVIDDRRRRRGSPSIGRHGLPLLSNPNGLVLEAAIPRVPKIMADLRDVPADQDPVLQARTGPQRSARVL